MRPKGILAPVVSVIMLLAPLSVAKAEASSPTSGEASLTVPQLAPSPTAIYGMQAARAAQVYPAPRVGRSIDLQWRRLEIIASATSSLEPDNGPFRPDMPLDRFYLNSGFGERWHPALGGPDFHTGIDLAATMGTPVYAAFSGTVETAGNADSYGILVAIRHRNSIETLYAHLSRTAVKEGDPVERGQIIGYVGSTGRSTGPHLHFEVRKRGRAIDPMQYWAR